MSKILPIGTKVKVTDFFNLETIKPKLEDSTITISITINIIYK